MDFHQFDTQYRNPHSYMVDFADEDDLYNRVDDLLQALASRTSDGHETLETAYLDLIHKLVKECGILETMIYNSQKRG